MTAKDKLRQAVEELTEPEAEQALAFIARRRDRDPMIEAFENAPEDDEAFTTEDAADAEEAWAACQRGDAVPVAQVRHALD